MIAQLEAECSMLRLAQRRRDSALAMLLVPV